jgi:hypothetical protein
MPTQCHMPSSTCQLTCHFFPPQLTLHVKFYIVRANWRADIFGASLDMSNVKNLQILSKIHTGGTVRKGLLINSNCRCLPLWVVSAGHMLVVGPVRPLCGSDDTALTPSLVVGWQGWGPPIAWELQVSNMDQGTYSSLWGFEQWSGRFLGVIGWDLSVCKSNWLHVDILLFFFIKFNWFICN